MSLATSATPISSDTESATKFPDINFLDTKSRTQNFLQDTLTYWPNGMPNGMFERLLETKSIISKYGSTFKSIPLQLKLELRQSSLSILSLNETPLLKIQQLCENLDAMGCNHYSYNPSTWLSISSSIDIATYETNPNEYYHTLGHEIGHSIFGETARFADLAAVYLFPAQTKLKTIEQYGSNLYGFQANDFLANYFISEAAKFGLNDVTDSLAVNNSDILCLIGKTSYCPKSSVSASSTSNTEAESSTTQSKIQTKSYPKFKSLTASGKYLVIKYSKGNQNSKLTFQFASKKYSVTLKKNTTSIKIKKTTLNSKLGLKLSSKSKKIKLSLSFQNQKKISKTLKLKR